MKQRNDEDDDGERPFDCEEEGMDHEVVDCSSHGPDSGDMDHCCSRCGRHWHVQLY